MNFICGRIPMAAFRAVEPFDVDQLVKLAVEVHHHEAGALVNARSTIAVSAWTGSR